MRRRILLVFLAASLILAMPSLADEPDPVGFCDAFETTTLDAEWLWENPAGDCTTSLTSRPHTLEISAPPGTTHILTESAPRLLQPVTGDFVIETKAICPTSGIDGHSLGLLMYQDSHNYIGSLIGGWPRTLRTEARVAGAYQSWQVGDYDHNSVYFKITRSGQTFAAQYSLDDTNWRTITSVTYPAQDVVWVGLYLNDWGGQGASGLFDYFRVKGCPRIIGGELPENPRQVEAKVYPLVTAPGARFGVQWVAQGGLATSDTFLMWDTTSHEHLRDYAHRTASQAGGMDRFVDYVEVPEDAGAVYFLPCAVIDGEMVYGASEICVSTGYNLNVGADAYGMVGDSDYYHPDRESNYSPTSYEIWGGERVTTDHDIADTLVDWIHQSQRVGIQKFSAWLGPDVYEMALEVGLHLAELDDMAVGQRVFDVVIEPGTPNELIIPNVDVLDLAGGAETAVTISRTVNVTVDPGIDEHLDIAFVGHDGAEPILNAITIRGHRGVPVFRIDRLVGTGVDDTYTGPSGTNTYADEMWLGGNEQYHGGLRFPALYIPQGAVIRSAELAVTSSASSSMLTLLDVYAHAADSSPSFASQAVVHNRPRTDVSVPWEIRGDYWRPGSRYTSPDLAPVIQEIVDRPGWQTANALSLLLIAGEGHSGAPRKVYATEGSYANRAGLTVYYSEADDVPTPTPTATATPTTAPTTYPMPGPWVTATPGAWLWLPMLTR